MVTLIAFLVFAGFYTCYYTSVKAVLIGHSGLEIAIRKNTTLAKRIGGILLLAGLSSAVFYDGIGAGTLQFFIMLMASGSLVILLSPLKILTLRSASIAFAIGFLIEISNLI